MSWLDRAWRLIRPPLVYLSVVLGVLLGVMALGMVTRGLLVEGSIPGGRLLATMVGGAALIAFGLGLRVRSPG